MIVQKEGGSGIHAVLTFASYVPPGPLTTTSSQELRPTTSPSCHESRVHVISTASPLCESLVCVCVCVCARVWCVVCACIAS